MSASGNRVEDELGLAEQKAWNKMTIVFGLVSWTTLLFTKHSEVWLRLMECMINGGVALVGYTLGWSTWRNLIVAYGNKYKKSNHFIEELIAIMIANAIVMIIASAIAFFMVGWVAPSIIMISFALGMLYYWSIAP